MFCGFHGSPRNSWDGCNLIPVAQATVPGVALDSGTAGVLALTRWHPSSSSSGPLQGESSTLQEATAPYSALEAHCRTPCSSLSDAVETHLDVPKKEAPLLSMCIAFWSYLRQADIRSHLRSARLHAKCRADGNLQLSKGVVGIHDDALGALMFATTLAKSSSLESCSPGNRFLLRFKNNSSAFGLRCRRCDATMRGTEQVWVQACETYRS